MMPPGQLPDPSGGIPGPKRYPSWTDDRFGPETLLFIFAGYLPLLGALIFPAFILVFAVVAALVTWLGRPGVLVRVFMGFTLAALGLITCILEAIIWFYIAFAKSWTFG
jgi:hypothetical protein